MDKVVQAETATNEPELQFPFMIYHPVFKPEIIYDREKLIEMLDKGWRTSPVPASEEEMILSKIKWHEAEIRILKKNLDAVQKENERFERITEKQKVEEARELIRASLEKKRGGFKKGMTPWNKKPKEDKANQVAQEV